MIPDEIRIGSRTVKVTMEPNLELNGQKLLGMFMPDKQEIVLSADIQSADVLMETFWHELVHAINDFVRFDVQLQHEIESADSSSEAVWNFNETFTERFSVTLLQVIRDNNLVPLAQ